MNWSQFKDLAYHLSFIGAVVASWSLTLETTGLDPLMKIFLSLNSANSVNTFRENLNIDEGHKDRVSWVKFRRYCTKYTGDRPFIWNRTVVVISPSVP